MNFGEALEKLKLGEKLARPMWEAVGMFVVLMPALELPPHSSQEPGAKVNDRTAKHIGEDTPLNSRPYLAMFIGFTGEWQPGWTPQQSDLFADDWEVVK
jgi:hypothetical protein